MVDTCLLIGWLRNSTKNGITQISQQLDDFSEIVTFTSALLMQVPKPFFPSQFSLLRQPLSAIKTFDHFSIDYEIEAKI
jgi:hypothetical protein